MTCLSRRGALGAATVALCHLPARAAADPAVEACTRQAIDTYARAWERGDVPALLNCYHADFTLNWFGRNALAGRHVGKAAATKALGEMRQRTGRQLKAIRATMVAGDQAVMVTREAFATKGLAIEVERLYLYTVAGEQLRECWVYDQDQRQLDDIIGP